MVDSKEILTTHTWCRFGKWGWGTAAFLACYVLVLTSNFYYERATQWVQWENNAYLIVNKKLLEQVREFNRLAQATETMAGEMFQLNYDLEVLKRYQCSDDFSKKRAEQLRALQQ